MRAAFRRIFWLLPNLVVLTMLAFGAVEGALGQGDRNQALFFSSRVTDVSTRVEEVVASVAQRPSDTRPQQELLRLGGAALPHIFGKLDSFSPTERRRVAVALMPLAERMGLDGLPSDAGVQDGTPALRFWRRFWEEHKVDFRPVVVRRAVRRYMQRETQLRRRELQQLDTYALEELMVQLQSTADLQQRLRLLRAIDHATHLPGAVSRPRRSAEEWVTWWSKHRFEFVLLRGIERLIAPVIQTRYASWAREAARTQFGTLSSGEPALATFRNAAPTTLLLFLSGLLGGATAALITGALAFALPPNWRRNFSRVLAQSWTLAPLLVVALSSIEGPPSATHIYGSCWVMLSLGAVLAQRYQQAGLDSIQQQRWVLTYRAQGVSPARLAWLAIRPASGSTLATLVPHSTTLLTAAFVLEHLLGLPGLGQRTVQALHTPDVTWLMLVTLACACMVALLQILNETLLSWLTPAAVAEQEHAA